MSRVLLVLAVVLVACTPDAVPPSAPQNALVAAAFAFSPDPCTFTVRGTTMKLDADCSTTESIVIPDGFTLDGAHHTITAVESGGPFLGAVLVNGGTTAHVRFVHIRTLDLASVCHSDGVPDNRLRGILFNGAGGSITHSSVIGLNQGPSGCQEGNAIDVRNPPFDGTHPATLTVEIAHNVVDEYQKTGIVCNGDLSCSIHHNTVGASATQANLAANSIQVGFGALASVVLNSVKGNSWCGPSDFVATAILLYNAAPGTVVGSNRISGNSDVGIYGLVDGGVISKNSVDDIGPDCNVNGYDFGIGDWGSSYPDPSNSVTKNKAAGFDFPYDPETSGGKNQVKKKPRGAPGN